MPPSLYHSIPKCGTLGGEREKSPVMLTWGSFSFGRDQEKLNFCLMAEITEPTAFLAASILPTMAL